MGELARLPVRYKGKPLTGDRLQYWLCLKQFAKTARQREKIEAVILTGSQVGACRVLGLSPGAVHDNIRTTRRRADPYIFPGMQYSEVDLVCYLMDKGPQKMDGEAFADLIGYAKSTFLLAVKRLEERTLIDVKRFPDIWGPEGCNEYSLRIAWHPRCF